MTISVKPATQAPTSTKGGSTPNTSNSTGTANATRPGRQFVALALDMSWKLAVVVLVPVLGGVGLDKAIGVKYAYLLIGLAVAAMGTAVVLWQTLQTANKLPVPKLTDAQKRDIRKRYEEDDDQ
ncbi:MAG TPA: hypothetical protein VLE99_03165 [Candidatus Saccharimonadales bacterium]|nr:hypothetical protein [Candidatus Saccharimonadales bacterium]